MSISDTGRPGFVWDGTDWVPILAPVSDGSFIGSIVAWAGNTPPTGWQLCDGGEPQSAALRALVGDTVPDLRDRFIVGASATKAKGATGGSETVTLTAAQMPGHSHTIRVNTFPPGDPINGQVAVGSGAPTTGRGEAIQTSADNSGGGQAHDNMPPYWALAWIIKHTGEAANGITMAEADAAFLTPAEGDARYEPLDSAYTKAEADAKFGMKVTGGSLVVQAQGGYIDVATGMDNPVAVTGASGDPNAGGPFSVVLCSPKAGNPGVMTVLITSPTGAAINGLCRLNWMAVGT